MQDIRYDRLCRTPYSESYLISRGEDPVARVELHFTQNIVYGLLVLEKDLEEREITDLIDRVDEDLVWSADVARDDLVVTVYRGHELGVYSSPDYVATQEEQNGSSEDG